MKPIRPLIEVISDCIRQLPQVEFRSMGMEPSFDDKRVDFEILLDIQGQPIRLLLEEKKAAYPRDVRAVLPFLKSLRNDSPKVLTIPMLLAPSIPISSREYLREQKIAYGDGSGSLYLPLPSAMFYVDRPVPHGGERKIQSIYKGRTAQILHILLSKLGYGWHVNELAIEAGVASSTVHQVFTELEKLLWVERIGTGPELVRVLREPGALLNAWREEHSLKQYEVRSYYCRARSAAMLRSAVTKVLEERNTTYALTLSSGAELVAPFVTGIERVSLLMPKDHFLDSNIDLMKLEPAEEGANVTLLITESKSPFLLRRRVQDFWVVGDIQLYLDLWASPARGKEQAEHLRKERLSF